VIEGDTSSIVGEEGKVMYVGGIIRPEDIGTDNTIDGSFVAGLTVREIPSGVSYDSVRRSWGTRLVEQWKPF
ncbi:MAG: flagellar basal body L-ring protein FlgH, partial [Thermoguttaceae bacterium]